MPKLMDPMGREILLAQRPQKIISLVPSQSELLHDLGLDKEVVGITKFCVHPAKWAYPKKIVGGTKNVNLDLIRMMGPDLVLGNKEENERVQIEILASNYPTWISDVRNLQDATRMIHSIGNLTDTVEPAKRMAESLEQKYSKIIIADNLIPAAYLIWHKPWMAAGGHTFIDDMMKYCGLKNVFDKIPRYPEISLEQLQSSGCKLVLLSSEPFPFSEKHLTELAGQLKGIRVMLADGQMFSWYGSRLLQASDYLQSIRLQIQQ